MASGISIFLILLKTEKSFKKNNMPQMMDTHKDNDEMELMSIQKQKEAIKQLKGWRLISSFSVGGFEYFGLTKQHPNKVMIISSQKTTILDCDTGLLEECEADYDEENLIAYCDSLPDCFSIMGKYGGELSKQTDQGDYVDIKLIGSQIFSGRKLYIQQISFIDKYDNGIVIYRGYPVYICGFGFDGDYFLFADDGGVYVLKRDK